MDFYSFEKLLVYQEARNLLVSVYKLAKRFPNDERFGLTAQLRRAIVSVPSNLAEGSGRVSVREKIHFLGIAFGSLMEAFCQLQIATDLGYITEAEFDCLRTKFLSVSRLINGLTASFKKKIDFSIIP